MQHTQRSKLPSERMSERERKSRARERETERRVRERVGRQRAREKVIGPEYGRRERYQRRSSPRHQADGKPRTIVRRWSCSDEGYNHHNKVDVRWSTEQEEDNDPTTNQGVWLEVTHRRKKKLVENRGRVDRSSLKWQDRKMTWRNKEDVTTFYFSRFPEGIKEKDLWQIFQKWGKVWEVFIPKSKNKEGHRFGFVRFKEVEDERRLERQLDNNIYIGGMKLFVNTPRFDRGRVFRAHQNGTSIQRVVSTQEVHKGNQEVMKLKCSEGRPRSYVEVVREEMYGEGSSYRKKEVPQSTRRSMQRPVVLSSHRRPMNGFRTHGWGD